MSERVGGLLIVCLFLLGVVVEGIWL